MVFKTIDRKKVDLFDFVKKHMFEHPNDKILIGCDSQNTKNKTVYALVVGFYDVGHGAKILFHKWTTNKEYISNVRLLNEVWKSVELAEEFKKSGYRVDYIDIDINPDPKYKSNDVFRQAVGLCEGMGYNVRYKHNDALITSMADSIVRGYAR